MAPIFIRNQSIATIPIRWLHLSDFHTGKEDHPQAEIFTEILKEIERRVAEQGAPDFVFFTGDVANKGKTAEYTRFQDNFYQPLLKIFGVGWPGKIYTVPGNHDIDCDEARGFHRPGVFNNIPELFDPNTKGLKERAGLFPRIQAFSSSQVSTIDTGWLLSESGVFTEIISCSEISLGILGLNTGWLTDKDDGKQAHLVVTPGLNLVKSGLSKLQHCHIKLVLGHHPISCFQNDEKTPIKALFAQNQIIYLHGHLHEIGEVYEYAKGHFFRAVQTGACFQVRPGIDKLLKTRILWCKLDLEDLSLTVEPFFWHHDGQEWRIDTEAFPNKWQADHGLKWILPADPEKQAKTIQTAATASPGDYDPKNPVFHVPYKFKGIQVIGREATLRRVREQLTAGCATGISQTASFQGLGGLGKTQMAVEYAFEYREDYPNGVIWLNADQDLEAQLIEIAEKAAWVAPASEHHYKLEIARRRLRSFSDCLIIFDNVENILDLRNYFPEPQAKPHTLITSRTEQPGFPPIRPPRTGRRLKNAGPGGWETARSDGRSRSGGHDRRAFRRSAPGIRIGRGIPALQAGGMDGIL